MLPAMPIIYLWPVLAFILFKRFSLPTALCWTIIAGYLFLPERVGLDLPMLPAINKKSVPSFAALVFALLLAGQHYQQHRTNSQPQRTGVQPGLLPGSLAGRGLFFMMLLGVLMMVLTNGDRISYNLVSLPPLRIYDIFAATLTMLVALLPLLLGRKYLATPEAQRALLITLAMAGFAYSFLALYEIRMSPRLNLHVYGFAPAGWRQHLRGDGFRPMVFLKHGLWLGIFMACAFLAALAWVKVANPKKKMLYVFLALWLFITLFLSKTFGAFMIAVLLAPALLFLTVRIQVILAACVAGMVLLYPMLRGADLIPVDRAVTWAAKVDPDRASSLQYRLNNEDILLAKANQRPLFGWGGWGRARVYNENGRDVSTTDGLWVITIGEEGWFGYLGRFGMLCGPIILLAWRQRKMQLDATTGALCLILAGNLIDLIPNAGLTAITWLVAGSLWGRLEYQVDEAEDMTEPEIATEDRGTKYSRPRPRKSRQTATTPALDRGKPSYARSRPSSNPS